MEVEGMKILSKTQVATVIHALKCGCGVKKVRDESNRKLGGQATQSVSWIPSGRELSPTDSARRSGEQQNDHQRIGRPSYPERAIRRSSASSKEDRWITLACDRTERRRC